MTSNVIFAEFHVRLLSTDFVVVLGLVHVPRAQKNYYLEEQPQHEDEYEKNQINMLFWNHSTAYFTTMRRCHGLPEDIRLDRQRPGSDCLQTGLRLFAWSKSEHRVPAGRHTG
jgi:hypothetical protein